MTHRTQDPGSCIDIPKTIPTQHTMTPLIIPQSFNAPLVHDRPDSHEEDRAPKRQRLGSNDSGISSMSLPMHHQSSHAPSFTDFPTPLSLFHAMPRPDALPLSSTDFSRKMQNPMMNTAMFGYGTPSNNGFGVQGYQGYNASFPMTGFTMSGFPPTMPPPAPVIPTQPARPVVFTAFWDEQAIEVLQLEYKGHIIARRLDNDFVNGTKLLNMTVRFFLKFLF